MPSFAYQSPGVSVSESSTPVVAPLTALPAEVAIVGPAQGYQIATDSLLLSSIVAQQLSHTGVITSSVSVVNVTQNSATVDAGNYEIKLFSNPDTIVSSGDEVYTINRVPAPATAPVVVNSGTGTLTGDYVYAVSFVTPSGVVGETDLGPYSTTVTFSNQGANLSSIPVGSSGTTARKIYRAKVTGSSVGTFYNVVTISDNVTTTYSNETMTDATAATQSTPKQGIDSGDTVQVTYQYTDKNYYMPTFFDNFPDVVDKYGSPFDSNGNIGSKLSFAMRMAFLNGAQELIGLATVASGSSDFTTALDKLADIDNLSMATLVSSNGADHTALAAHCAAMGTKGLYRIGVVGQDSTSGIITPATLRNSAAAFNVENMILISPSSFNITNPVSLRPMAVGAQYMASAVLGMFAARDPQVPLTRKTVAGFLSPNEIRTNADAALDSASGLLVVEYKGNIFRIRHSLTTAVTDINKRESSVVRAKYEMARQLKDVLDRTVVGSIVPAGQAPQIVASAVSSVLEQMLNFGVIAGYANIVARVLASNPTTVEVRFEYTPMYPINNINVVFTINTQQGEFTVNF